VTKNGVVDWWVSVPGEPKGQYSDLFPGLHVANEITKPWVCINSNNSWLHCKKTATENGNLQPEIEINEYSSSKQEGQHPLTGQRAANFRPLANQWAERRLVKQWGHGCHAMGRSVCNAGVSNVGRSLCVQISRERSYPCQYIDTTRKAIDCATTLPLRVFI